MSRMPETFSTEGTLKIHMSKVHEQYVCTICGKSVQTSQKKIHITQHKTEMEFEKGLEKGRVSKTKKGDSDKVEKKLSGYQYFCDETIPVLRERHGRTREMPRLLGAEWKKLTEMEKLEWSKKAKQINLDRTRDIPAEAAEKQNTEPNKEQEPTKESCPFCENHYGNKTSLKVHIASSHFGIGTGNNLNRIPLLEDQETFEKCQICKKMINKSKIKKHMDENHLDRSCTVLTGEESVCNNSGRGL